MGKAIHKLSDLDTEALTAVCASCGPVDVSRKKRAKVSGDNVSYICGPGLRSRLIAYQKATGQSKRWRQENPGSPSLGPEASMLHGARWRAKQRGLEFDLTIEDIVFPERCPILGIPLVPGGRGREDSPSLDRKDNSRGYTRDNIQIISHRANRIKSDATKDELLAIAASM